MIGRLIWVTVAILATAARAEMAAGVNVRVVPDSQRPHIIDTLPDDGSTVHTATPQLQCVFDQDMNTARTIASKVLLPNGLQIQGINWSGPRTLDISYAGALPNYGAKRIDLADGYFVNTFGISIPVGGGWAFCYHPLSVQDPTIIGDITATPAVPTPGTEVTFNVTASDPGGNPLTYTWDYGDGTIAVGGPTPSHTYATAGPFLVTVKVDNGQGGTTMKALLLAGASTSPGGTLGNLEVINATICLVFAKAHKDKIQFSGSMNLPAGFSPGGKVAAVSFGGVTQRFTLSAKGVGTAKRQKVETFKLYYQLTKMGKGASNRIFIGGPIKFKVTMYGWFAETLAPLGCRNATTPKTPPTVLSVPVTASIDGNVGQYTTPLVWKSKVNASGIGSQRTVVK